MGVHMGLRQKCQLPAATGIGVGKSFRILQWERFYLRFRIPGTRELSENGNTAENRRADTAL